MIVGSGIAHGIAVPLSTKLDEADPLPIEYAPSDVPAPLAVATSATGIRTIGESVAPTTFNVPVRPALPLKAVSVSVTLFARPTVTPLSVASVPFSLVVVFVAVPTVILTDPSVAAVVFTLPLIEIVSLIFWFFPQFSG